MHLKAAIPALDKAAGKGLIHKKNASSQNFALNQRKLTPFNGIIHFDAVWLAGQAAFFIPHIIFKSNDPDRKSSF
ncbi:MAG: 30S ribosomal protein S20 [Rhodopseudomonas palustris]|nr:30S ribosomal protein S20 [Rhodopseudomonas palustris]